MKSISGKHAVEGEGYVLWSIPDTTGVLRNFKLKALWVPESQVRLLSTEGLLQTYKGESIELRSGELLLAVLTLIRTEIQSGYRSILLPIFRRLLPITIMVVKLLLVP